MAERGSGSSRPFPIANISKRCRLFVRRPVPTVLKQYLPLPPTTSRQPTEALNRNGERQQEAPPLAQVSRYDGARKNPAGPTHSPSTAKIHTGIHKSRVRAKKAKEKTPSPPLLLSRHGRDSLLPLELWPEQLVVAHERCPELPSPGWEGQAARGRTLTLYSS